MLETIQSTLIGEYTIQILHEHSCSDCSSLEFCKAIDSTLSCGTWRDYSSAASLEEALLLASSIEKYNESYPEELIRILTPDGQTL